MTEKAQTRVKTFERLVEESDDKQLEKVVKFEEHRFVSIERDSLTSQRYARGHRGLRSACSYLARVVEEGEPMVPEAVIDLDTGTTHELDLFVHVAPKSVDAVSVLLPRDAANAALNAVSASGAEGSMDVARTLLQQAIDRR